MTHSTCHRISLIFAMIFLTTASPVRAQSSTEAIVETPQSTVADPTVNRDDPVRLPRFEVGFGVNPFFMSYLDEGPCCFPLSGWVTVGSGRTRLQFDYLRNVRRQGPHYTPYYDTDAQGREIVVNRARSDYHVDQVAGAAIVWRFTTKGPTTGYLLAGAAYRQSADRWCVALGKPDLDEPNLPGQQVHVDFPAGHQCSNEPIDVTHRSILPMYGVGVDVGFGSRFFSSVQYRARLHPLLGELRVGVGIRF